MVDATGLGRCFNMKPRPRLFVTGLTGCIAVWGAVLLFAQPPFTGLYESNARRPGASHCTSATRSKSQRYSHGKLIASFPIEAVQYRRLSRFWGGDPGSPEAHRATAQLLPKSHVYIYESWKDMKAGRPSLLLPRSRNSPPVSLARTLARASPSLFAKRDAARRNRRPDRSICPGVTSIGKLWANQRAGPSRNFPRFASSSIDKCRGWLRSVRKPKT